MLNRLTVRNLAVVEQTEAEFASGLNVITGETGAGKSVLMGALELVLGGRADSSVVREGAKEAEVEAVFGERIVRRTVTATGKSRAWIDDESVTVAELREFAAGRVDIHGPRANQNLLDEDYQRQTLDAFGGVEKGEYSEAFAELEALRGEARRLEEAGGGEDELDFLRYQVNEIEGAELTEEDETVGERHATAAHSAEIVEGANAVTEVLGGDESVVSTLATVQVKLHAMARHFAEAEEWAAEAEELSARAEELSRRMADAVSRLDGGEEDFEALDKRLATVNRLKRKYGATVAEVLAKLEEKRRRLDELENRDAKLAEIGGRIAAAEERVRAAGAKVSAARKAAGAKLAKAVTKELHDLGFLKAQLTVALTAAEPTAQGCDRVAFMFEPNPGEPARELAAIASSGEIARVMLAMKGVLAAHDATETMVFDEIDANIGGEVGRAVGERLRAVARHRQVIAITHLPQSAVFGERHLVVAKRVTGGRTRTGISEVTGEDRIAEIARMLGGEKLTSVVRKHAEELLSISD